MTLKATPRSVSGAVWEFELVFDTHTQDLSDDVAKSALLLVDGAPHAPVIAKSVALARREEDGSRR